MELCVFPVELCAKFLSLIYRAYAEFHRESQRFMSYWFQHMTIPNLLIIAGTGNKSGKTTFACRLIEQFRSLDIISMKITPHFHETTAGLKLLKGESRNIRSMKKQTRNLKRYFPDAKGRSVQGILCKS